MEQQRSIVQRVFVASRVAYLAPVVPAASELWVIGVFVRYRACPERFKTTISSTRQVVMSDECWRCQLCGHGREKACLRNEAPSSTLGWPRMFMYFAFFYLGKIAMAQNDSRLRGDEMAQLRLSS